MKIEVARLPEGREQTFFEEWDAESHELNVPGWRYEGPLKVEAKVARDIGVIRADFSVSAVLDLTCSRCLKEFSRPFQKAFHLAYPIALSGKTILLDDDAREELILDYPQKVLCREDCKGLCVECGVDLNEGGCKCEKQ